MVNLFVQKINQHVKYCNYLRKTVQPILLTWYINCILFILIFSISAGLKRDFFLLPLGERGGVLPLEKLEVEVEPLWEDDRLSRLLELSTDRDLGASWVSRKTPKSTVILRHIINTNTNINHLHFILYNLHVIKTCKNNKINRDSHNVFLLISITIILSYMLYISKTCKLVFHLILTENSHQWL